MELTEFVKVAALISDRGANEPDQSWRMKRHECAEGWSALKSFSRRRRRLMELMAPGTIAVLPAATRLIRNRDTEFPFRQNSDFYYLTGFEESDALLVLAPGRAHGEVVLFLREREARFERYNGELLGPDRATQMLGVDDAFPMSDLADILPGMLEGRERIYATLGELPEFDKQLLGFVADIRGREAGGAVAPAEFVSLKHLLHELRLVKSAAELKVMKRAAKITVAAHVRAMERVRPGMTESALEAELVYEFMRSGARSPAYPSIVGGGANACTLHYTRNDAKLKRGDLVLIDAGCEYQHYASDVTRTFPVSGRFSKPQRAAYEAVLQAQAAAVAACRPGAEFDAPHNAAVRSLCESLLTLGIVSGSLDEILEKQSYLPYYPHKTSHWLGIDVHDVGDYRVDGSWRVLEPGMVLTIEPGLYFRDCPVAEFNNIGVRIEDDVLITSDGHAVLTDAAPKEVADVEKVVGASAG